MNGSVLHFQGFCGVSTWFPVTVRNAARNHTCNCAQGLEHFFLLRDKGATLHTLLTKAGTPVYLTYDQGCHLSKGLHFPGVEPKLVLNFLGHYISWRGQGTSLISIGVIVL